MPPGSPTTPNSIGFAMGLRQEADELLLHAQRIQKAFEANNLEGAKLHAEHVINIIEGQHGEHFGDLDGNAKLENPGDGFGLLPDQQDGYLSGMTGHALLAARAAGVSKTTLSYAEQIAQTNEALAERIRDIQARALNVNQAGSAAEIQADAAAILAQSEQLLLGSDANQDGQICIEAGEGGVQAVYQLAQRMAEITLLPGNVDRAPPAIAVQAEPQSTTMPSGR